MSATALEQASGLDQAYRRLFELGRGGMARVFLAESQAFGLRRLVVLKVLNPEFGNDPEIRGAFRREAELSAQMNHPNVVQVTAVLEHSGSPVIVMEYLDGTPLSALLKQAGKHLPLRLRMYILSQVLAGLHHFHELRDIDGAPLGAVHRDVSPQNVMILHDGPVKVLDFGIAKISATDQHATRTGTVKGKIHYMPPEQLLDGAHVDRRADIFAVGVMLWEAVADRRMWEGKTEVELLRSLATGSLPSLRDVAPEIPDSVLEIVRRATSLEREKRYSSAKEMQAAIDGVLAQAGWVVRPRELADFMLQHFGESRREQELKVNSALRALRGSDPKRDLTPKTRVVQKTEPRRELGNPTPAISDLPVARTLFSVKRPRRWALALTSGLVLLGTWATWRQIHAADPTTEQLRAQSVNLEIEASPRGAEIVLDGKLLSQDRYVGEQPVGAGKAVLEVRAPGHRSQRREISFRKDLALQIVLEPEPTAMPSSQSAVPSLPGADAPSQKAHAPAERQAGARAKSPTKPGSATASRSRNCNPPYRLGADGVKTYKPECF